MRTWGTRQSFSTSTEDKLLNEIISNDDEPLAGAEIGAFFLLCLHVCGVDLCMAVPHVQSGLETFFVLNLLILKSTHFGPF